VLQRVAVCCSVLQCVAVCCDMSQCVAEAATRTDMRCSVLQCAAACCSVIQCVSMCCNMLPCVAVICRGSNSRRHTLQCTAVRCSVLQCVAVHRSTSQYVALCSIVLPYGICCSVLQRPQLTQIHHPGCERHCSCWQYLRAFTHVPPCRSRDT